jgi:hypothetical protein
MSPRCEGRWLVRCFIVRLIIGRVQGKYGPGTAHIQRAVLQPEAHGRYSQTR